MMHMQQQNKIVSKFKAFVLQRIPTKRKFFGNHLSKNLYLGEIYKELLLLQNYSKLDKGFR